MATNENVNKVIYGNQTVMDITDTTAEESDVASGEVFYKADGARSVGTLNADSAVWGNISGTLSDQTDLQIELNRAYTKTASETSSIDDLDLIPVQKISASSDGRRNIKFRNLKQILTNFFDTVYQTILTLPLSTANGGTGNASGYIRTGVKSGTTVGYYATAEGYNTTASGISSHAEGEESIASSAMAHAEGYTTTASGRWSHAEGYQAVASGDRSHAEGYNTTASGEGSHAEGYRAKAIGSYSHAEGEATTAGYSHQHVQGVYNDNKSTTLFEVGNGTANNARSNAFEVYSDGHINVNGDIYQNGKLYNDKATQGLLKSTVGWTGKNEFPITITSVKENNTSGSWSGNAYTFNGITYILSEDGEGNITEIDSNGTASANAALILLPYKQYSGDKIISGCNNGSSSTYELLMMSSTSGDLHCYNGDNDVTPQNDRNYQVRILVRSGQTVDHIKFYPMLRDASITDDTYEPYHESVEEVVEQIYADNGVLGAKNLLPNNATSKTINGVTFTVNDDGSVTVNGTASDYTAFIISTNIFKNYANIPLVCSAGNKSNSIHLRLWNRTDSTWYIASNHLDDIYVTPSETDANKNIEYQFVMPSGATVNNIKVYPMLRLASDPDDTYVPYAMTNRELTAIAQPSDGILQVGKLVIITKQFTLNTALSGGEWNSNRTDIVFPKPLKNVPVKAFVSGTGFSDMMLGDSGNNIYSQTAVESGKNIYISCAYISK